MCLSNFSPRETKRQIESDAQCFRGCNKDTMILIELPDDKAMLECSMCQLATQTAPREEVKMIWEKMRVLELNK